MSFRSAQQSRVYVHDIGMAAYARSLSSSLQVAMHDVTVLTDTAKAMVPGANESTFTLSGPLDSDGLGFTPSALLKLLSLPKPVTYMPLGADGAAQLFTSYRTQIDTSSSHSGTVDWTMSTQTSGITDINGVILENNTTVTADTDGTAHTGPAGGTSNGAVFHLHVTAYSGFTSDDIIVEGSTTGSFGGEETTIATFTQITSTNSEAVVVTGTVPRYLRVVDNVTGTGSITRLVAVSRR